MNNEEALEELYLTLDSLLSFEMLMLKHLTGQIKIIGYTEESVMQTIFDICKKIFSTKEKINEILDTF